MLAAAAIIAVIYYKVIDSAAFNKPKHWLLTLLIVVSISGVCGYLIINGDFSTYKEDNPDSDIIVSTMDCVLVGVMNVIYSTIVYFVCSILIKGLSHNCRVIPTKRFNLFR